MVFHFGPFRVAPSGCNLSVSQGLVPTLGCGEIYQHMGGADAENMQGSRGASKKFIE